MVTVMAQKNRALMIIGSIVLGLVSVLLVYVILISTGAIVGREYTIRFEAISREKEYDGTPLLLNDYRIVEGEEYLTQNGHYAMVSFSGNQTDVGESTGYLDVAIFDEHNAEVTSRYNIVTTGATLKVTPRTIVIKTYGAEKAYDGTSIDVSSVATPYEVISGEAVVGQYLQYHASGIQTEIGSSPVMVDIEAFDANNNPINPENYKVVYEGEQGQITVRPRYLFVNVTVANQNAIHYYNGSPHEVGTATVINSRSELRPGDSVVSINSLFSEINAGEYNVDKFSFKVVDSTGHDVTSMYTLDPLSQFPTYTISKVPITLQTLNLPFTYDGKVHTGGNNYDVKNWSQAAPADRYDLTLTESIIDAGEVENKGEIIIHNAKGEDVTFNYEISYDFGTLEVTKRPITITTYSDTKPFDGTPLVGSLILGENGKNYEISAGTLAENQDIEVTLSKVVSGVGETRNTVDKVVIFDEKKNDVTKNYNITKDEGNLVITKTSIKITTGTDTWLYDGEEHSLTDDYTQVEGLPNTCKIVYYDWPVITDATFDLTKGEIYYVDNKPEYVIYDANNNKVFDSKNKNYQDNFTVSSETWGKLCVRPIEITIRTTGAEKEYDGTPIECHIYEIIAGEKRLTDVISTSWPNDYTNVLRDKKTKEVIDVENKPVIVITDKNNKDITKNYWIKYECARIKINPVSVFVKTKDVDKVYDGKPLVVTENDYEITGLRGTDYVDSVSTVSNYINVEKKSRDNLIEFVIRNSSNQDITDNYSISYEKTGQLTIYPLEINFYTGSKNDFIYDGEIKKYEDYRLEFLNITEEKAQKFSATNISFREFSEANEDGTDKSKENNCTWDLQMELDTGEKVRVNKDNYHVNNIYGTVIVKKLKVYEYLESHTKEYDAKPFGISDVDKWFILKDEEGNEITDGNGNLTSFDGVKVSINESRLSGYLKEKNATVGKQYKVDLIFTDNSGKDITNNFDVRMADGSDPLLIITKVNLRISSPHFEATYNGVKRTVEDGMTLYVHDGEGYKAVPTNGSYLTLGDGRKFRCELSAFKEFLDANGSGEANSCTFKLYIKTINGDEEVESKNYNLDKQFGIVTIKKLDISVFTQNRVHPYDGSPEVYNEGALAGDALKDYRESWYQYYVDGSLPIGCEIELDENALNESIKNFIDYDNDGYQYKVKIKVTKNGNDDVNKNFNIEYSSGKIMIEPIDVQVHDNNLPGYSKYTGESYWTSNEMIQTYLNNISVTGLPVGYEYEITNKDFVNVNISSFDPKEKRNEFTIKITKDGKIVPIENFNLDISYNNIIIDYKEITVVNKNVTNKPYNGLPISYLNTNDVSADNWYTLVNEDNIDVTLDLDKFNLFLSDKIDYQNDGYSFDMTKYLIMNNPNYKLISSDNGSFNRDRIKVTALCRNTKDALDNTYSKYYDGTPLYAFSDVNDIVFNTTSQEKLKALYGVPNINDVYTYLELVSGTSLTDVKRGTKGAVETEEVHLNMKFKNQSGDDITHNFDIDYDHLGSLKILPIVITYKSASDEFTYDGTEKFNSTLEMTSVEKGDSTLDVNDYTFDTSDGLIAKKFINCNDVDKYGNRIAYDNEVTYKLVVTRNIDSANVSSNFDTRLITGKIIIKPVKIQIVLLGGEKVFDGTPIDTKYKNNETNVYKEELMSRGLLEVRTGLDFLNNPENEFTWDIIPLGSQLKVGEIENSFNFVITDKLGNDISSNFEVTNIEKVNNKLIIRKLELDVESLSKTKIYDPGSPSLYYHEIKNASDFEDSLPLGWTYEITDWATQTGIGKCKNDFTVSLVDSEGHAYNKDSSFWGCVSTDYKYGELEIIPYITGTGNLAKNENISDNGITSFSMSVDKEGMVYLRDRSYGNYNGVGWDYIPDYNGAYNGNAILAKVLDDNSYSNSSHITLAVSNEMPYLTPYYATNSDLFTNLNGGDTHTAKSHSSLSPYEYDFYNYNYNMVDKELSDVNYIAFESEYRDYVKANYLTIDPQLKDNILQMEGAPKGDEEDLIVKIAEYIRSNRFTYGENVNRKTTDDLVSLFLFDDEKGKMGTCQDFASAATMMYRAYDVPARFVTGFACYVSESGTYKPNTEINVNQALAHAWVEIYVDGMGWVNVEATPITAGGDEIPLNISNGGDSGESISASGVSGDISKTLDEPNNNVILEVKSQHSGTIYLRGQSFGSYNGAGFDTVESEDAYIDGDYNPLNYVAYSNPNYQTYRMYITPKGGGYHARLTPYYSNDDFKESNDTYLEANYNSKYATNFIVYPYENYDMENTLKGTYLTHENTYRSYVNARYKTMEGASAALLDYIDEIIADNNLNTGTTQQKIKKIAKYLQYDAGLTYSFDFDYNDSEDVALSFIRDQKKGVCQHFAMIGTLLYRRVGIPARYTCGVVVNISNEDAISFSPVEVRDSSSHAWVEVYINGFGWAPVEVTGPILEPNVGAAEIDWDDEVDEKEVIIAPHPIDRKYNALDDNIEIDVLIASFSLSDKGKYTVVGSARSLTNNLGRDNVTVVNEYHIYDNKTGLDVTKIFNVTLQTGTARLYLEKIIIETNGATKDYDGTPLTCHEISSYNSEDIHAGHTFNAGNLVFNQSITEPGTVVNTIDIENSVNLITDEYGNDVTSDYWVVSSSSGKLVVKKRSVVITAGSIELNYDDYQNYVNDTGEEKYVHHGDLTVTGLGPGDYLDTVTFDEDSFISESQDYAENIITSVVIRNSSNEDVTSYYNVNLVEGTIELVY